MKETEPPILEAQPMTKGQAMNQVALLLQMAGSMGNNDSEPGRIMEIQAKLQNDDLAPEEAFKQAHQIVYGKVEPT